MVHLARERKGQLVVGMKGVSYLSKHLLHPLLVSLDVLHLPLQTVLHLVLDQVNADPSLSVLDTLIIDPVKNKER